MFKHSIRRLLGLTLAALMLLSTASAAYETLRIGDKGTEVYTMQTALIQLGYQIEADGSFGRNTRAAVTAFQKDYGLKVDGLAGNQTLTMLYSLTGQSSGSSGSSSGSGTSTQSSLSAGSSGAAVTQLQQMLAALGYNVPIDGQYGLTTTNAVRQFQADYGLKVDGIAGSDTQLLLSQMTMNLDTLARVVTPLGGTLTLREERRTSAAALALIPNQTILSVSQRSSTWCKVYYGGQTGYVLTKYLDFSDLTPTVTAAPTATPTPAPLVTLLARVETPLGGTLTLRETQKTSAAALALIPNLTILTVLQRGSTWSQATYSGRTGYVLTQYLNFNYGSYPITQPTATPAPSGAMTATVLTSNGGGLNLRAYAETNAKVLAVIPNLSPVTVTARGSVWSAVTYNGISGYAMTGYLNFDGSQSVATPTPTPAPTPAPQTVWNAWISTNGSKLNLRTEPSMGDNIILSLANGTAVTVTERGSTWSYITAGSVSGWVQTQYLSFSAAPAAVTPTPTPAGGYDQTLYTRSLRSGYTGSDVIALQMRLNALNYPVNVTGTYDAMTIAAVQAFQRLNGLTVDGVAGAKTFTALYAANVVPYTGGAVIIEVTPLPATPTPTPVPISTGGGYDTSVYPRTLRSGYTGSDVIALQARLSALNYPVSVTGTYDAQTIAAVKLFQGLHGLTQDGTAGPKTLTALYSANVVSYSTEISTYSTLRIYYKTDTADAAAVTRMQQALSALGYRVNVTGRFDELTHNAVQQFQLRNGLTVTGAADAATQARILSSGALGYSAAPALSLSVTDGLMTVPNKSEINLLHWYNVVKPLLRGGNTLKILNPANGTTWNLRVMSCGHHCDAEPASLRDTLLMNRSFNDTTSWVVHAVYVQLPDGRWTMATMHNRPHLNGSVSDNGFDGHLCVHFLRDMSEAQQNDPDYGVQNQTVLRSAWLALTGEAVE